VIPHPRQALHGGNEGGAEEVPKDKPDEERDAPSVNRGASVSEHSELKEPSHKEGEPVANFREPYGGHGIAYGVEGPPGEPKPRRREEKVKEGDFVEIVEGEYRGLRGKIKSINKMNKAKLVVLIFGKPAVIDVPVSHLKKVL